jgi:hypothetical protein
MKSKIFALAAALSVVMAANAFAQAVGSQFSPPNLSGLYRCVRYCAGVHFARVTAYGWQLSVTNQAGEAIRGWIDWPGHIRLPVLNETAVYSPDGFTIQFSRGPAARRSGQLNRRRARSRPPPESERPIPSCLRNYARRSKRFRKRRQASRFQRQSTKSPG